MKTALHTLLVTLAVSSMASCAHTRLASHTATPLPIISLKSRTKSNAATKYIMLHLDYGIIVTGDHFYLFDRKRRKIFKTKDMREFLKELFSINHGASIDLIDRCSLPWHTSFLESSGILGDLVKRKQCRVVSSERDDRLHVFFCWCECDYTILDEVPSEQPPAGDVLKAAPEE